MAKQQQQRQSDNASKEREYVFEAAWMPAGAGSTVIKYAGRAIPIKTINQRYTLPDKLGAKERARLMAALKANGFIDISRHRGETKPPGAPVRYRYTVIHPGHTKEQPVNQNVGVPIMDREGKPVKDKEGRAETRTVAIKNGRFVTEDVALYKSLIVAGFRELSKEVLK